MPVISSRSPAAPPLPGPPAELPGWMADPAGPLRAFVAADPLLAGGGIAAGDTVVVDTASPGRPGALVLALARNGAPTAGRVAAEGDRLCGAEEPFAAALPVVALRRPRPLRGQVPRGAAAEGEPAMLHLDIDAFFAAVEVLQNPALRGKPVIVGGLASERGVVCTASYEARKFGVHSGMALRTAAAKCPQGVFLRGRYPLYRQVSSRFFAVLHRHSPRVEELSVDEAAIDLAGSRYLAPSVQELAVAIQRQAVRETGLAISAGLGATRLLAKLASEAAKPGGLFLVFDGETFLSGLEVERIPGIGPQTAFVLRGLGVRRVSELRERYVSLWKRIFGFRQGREEGEGTDDPAKSASRETTFPEDIADRPLLRAHLAYLTGRLADHLRRENLYCGRLEVKVRFADFSTVTRRRRLPYPTYAAATLRDAAFSLLGELLAGRRLPLRLVGAKVEDLSPRRDILPFWDLRGERMTRGVGAVKDRYGFSALATGRELLLSDLYPVEREGVVLKTASLTK